MFEFVEKYFLDPIKYNTGYNIVNTTVYAIILVAAVFLIYKAFKRFKIKVDRYFITGAVPYIVLGSIMRVLQDKHVLDSIIFITPLMYITAAAITVVALITSRTLSKITRIDYWKIWLAIGIAADVIAISYLRLANLYGLTLIVTIFAAWALALYAVKKITNWGVFTRENMLLLLVHVFDATSTFVSIQFFDYGEQHVLANIFMDTLGSAGMYVLKIPVVLAVLWLVDKEKDKDIRNIIKFVILVLGLGPGLRNTLTLVMS